MIKITSCLRLGTFQEQKVEKVLARLDSVLFGNEFAITKRGAELVVKSVSADQEWIFQNRDFFLGHIEALNDFTTGTLFHLK